MADDTRAPDGGRPGLPDTAVIARLGLIGLVMLCVAGAFAYVGGWLSPGRLTPDRMLAALHDPTGDYSGFRRNHAKGVCVSGWFDSNGQAASLSRAALFMPGRIPIVGRFALAGGMAFQPDKPSTVRSMALRFLPPGQQEWRTGINNIPVFPVKSAGGFYDMLIATRPDPATGKPDPARMKAFFAAHPEAAPAIALIMKRRVSSGFADSTFNSLDAFRFVSAGGAAVPVRWMTVPMQAFTDETPAQAAAGDKNYLFDDLVRAIRQQPLQWKLVVTVGLPGDPTSDATLPWPGDRRQVDAGMITLDHAESEDTGRCTSVNYDPLVLPSGIEASDDPILSARSAAYARSYTLRAGESGGKRPSAVTAADVHGGGRS